MKKESQHSKTFNFLRILLLRWSLTVKLTHRAMTTYFLKIVKIIVMDKTLNKSSVRLKFSKMKLQKP